MTDDHNLVAAAGSLLGFSGGSSSAHDGNPVYVTARGTTTDLGLEGHADGLLTSFGGTFNDVAAWPLTFSSGTTVDESATSADPTHGYNLAAPTNLAAATGGVGSTWTRNTLSFVPPRKARVLVPGATTGTITAGNRMWLDAWQLSVTPSATSWAPPKRLTPTVVPTRMNLSWCNGFEHEGTLGITGKVTTEFSGASPGQTDTVGYDSSLSASGSRCLKVVVGPGPWTPPDGWWVRENQIFEVDPGGFISMGFSYTNKSSILGARPAIQFFTEGGLFISTTFGDVIEGTNGSKFKQASVSGEVPANAYWAQTYWINAPWPVASGTVFHIDNVIVEKTSVLGDYLDGDSDGGVDCLWDANRALGDGWSYYYENRIARNGALNRILAKNVPLGVTVGTPQYATSTDRIFVSDDADFGESLQSIPASAF